MFKHILSDMFSELADWLERHPLVVLFMLSTAYFAFTVDFAIQKLLWDDEFFTLYISYAGYAGIWEALLTGADQHPPSFYWITYSILKLFGYSDALLRAPATVGFWLLLLSLFAITARRWSNLLGYTAFLIPITTATYWWAYDARGYGLLLGSAGAAFVFWELAIDDIRRKLTIPLFAFFLALAVCAHYYGILIVGPFVVGTAYYMLRKRHLDISLLLAHLSPAIPLAIFLPVINEARGYSDNFWARPLFSSVEGTIYTVFNSAGLTLLLLIVSTFVFGLFVNPRQQVTPVSDIGNPAIGAKLLALLCFVGIPLAGYLIGKFVTNAFNPRYATTSIIGITVILTGVLASLSKNSKSMQLGLLLVIIMGVGLKLPNVVSELNRSRADYGNTETLVKKYVDRGLPMAISEVSIFHRMAYYSPPKLKSKVFYLSNPEASVRWIGHDTIDRGLVDLSKWFHNGTVSYDKFLEENESFYIYGYIGDWTWLTYQLVDDGFQLTVLERNESRLVIRADRRMPLRKQ